MSETNEETQKLIQTGRDALLQARQLVQQNKAQEARAALEGARDTLAASTDDDPRVQELRAATYAELALLMQNLRDVRGALSNYAQAESILRALPIEEEKGLGYRLQLATTLINKSGLYASENAHDEGVSCSEEAERLLEGAAEGPAAEAVRMLQIGLLQNRHAILAGRGDLAGAEKAMATAYGVAEAMMAAGDPRMLQQAVDIAMKLAAVRRGMQRMDDAFAPAEQAEKWARAAYEVDPRLGIGPLVNVRMLQLELNFQAGQYAEAEDCLFDAVETSREDGRVLVIGTGFYMALLRLTDERLSEGGLPRAEVLESLDELMSKIESKQAPEALVETLKARRGVMVDGDVAAAESLIADLRQQNYNGDPATLQILPQLEEDIRWYRENRLV